MLGAWTQFSLPEAPTVTGANVSPWYRLGMIRIHHSVLMSLLGFLAVSCLPTADSADATAAAKISGDEVCVLETSLGTMTFGFFEAEAPKTVAQIKRLVREGFYDGMPFYRIVAGHVIQGGDGGENREPTVPGEFGAHPHVAGVVGLARDANPNSGNTEIYICLAPRPHLDGKYATFGKLIQGMDVLEKIGAVEVIEQWDGPVAFHKPKTPVIIKRAFLKQRPVD